MLPSPDEAYPPFSTEGQRRYDAVIVRLGRMVAERARAAARDGRANTVSDEHVDLVAADMFDGPPTRGIPMPLLSSMVGIAGAAVLAGLTGWRWANFAVAALLVIVVVVAVRHGHGSRHP